MEVVYSFIDSPTSKAMGLSLNCWSICKNRKKKNNNNNKKRRTNSLWRSLTYIGKCLYKPQDEVSRFGCSKSHLSTSSHFMKWVYFCQIFLHGAALLEKFKPVLRIAFQLMHISLLRWPTRDMLQIKKLLQIKWSWCNLKNVAANKIKLLQIKQSCCKLTKVGNEVLIYQIDDWSARMLRKLARVHDMNTVMYSLDSMQFM